MPNATISPVAGASVISALDSISPPAFNLYLYENDGEQGVLAYAQTNLYLYENDGEQGVVIMSGSDLYAYEMTLDAQVTPWLQAISPVQQYPLGQVQLFGDGLGQYDEVAASATITTSSVNGGALGSNMVNRTVGYWQSTDGTLAWCQFTWGAAQPVSIIIVEGLQDTGNQWGVPVFSFSDGLGNVVGGSAVPILTTVPAGASLGYPTVGWYRTAYALPAIRSTTYVKIAVSSGGAGTARGLGQVWILADNGKNAEPSTVLLNGELSGVTGTWLNRSPGLWPANGGQPITAAGTFTVPADASSGLVKVSEP